ncbi:MAG: hypothetical protein R6V34_07700 [Bacteroidales bacterium]
MSSKAAAAVLHRPEFTGTGVFAGTPSADMTGYLNYGRFIRMELSYLF